MTWQNKIYIKYNLSEKGVKLISDQTELLTHSSFTLFLKSEEKPYTVVTKVSEILENLNEANILLLANKLEIPSFVTNQIETINFHYSDIPLNGETQIFSDLSTDEIISILEYLETTNPHFVISQNEIKDTLKKAVEHSQKREIINLKKAIQSSLQEQRTLTNILSIAQLWAELQHISFKLNDTNYLEMIDSIDKYCNPYFDNSQWEEAFYAPNTNPKTVDKILHKMKSDNSNKKALLCFDCMGLSEWLLLKEFLQDINLHFEESSMFALLPSITSISRSAIYAGTYNIYDIAYSGQAVEEKNFKTFFGINNTLYLREKDYTNRDSLIGYDTVSILFNFFDDLSHSALLQENNLTKFNYNTSVQSYLVDSQVKKIFNDLLEENFTIYICSDHGSTIAIGNGKRIDKYLHDKFAKRGTIISKDSSELVENKKVNIPFIDDKIVVLPEKRKMFAYQNKLEINHGGITIEEMVVPFIKVKKK